MFISKLVSGIVVSDSMMLVFSIVLVSCGFSLYWLVRIVVEIIGVIVVCSMFIESVRLFMFSVWFKV